jgi:riboflavin-specific deaminase-like protein
MRTVSINMAMTIDGKIATAARGPVALGTPYDRRQMQVIRAEHDAVLNGSTTFKAHPFPLHVKGPALIKKRLREGREPQPLSAIVSSLLELPKNTPWEKAAGAKRWIFSGNKAPLQRVKWWESRGVRVLKGKGARPSPLEILGAFESEGIVDLLLEGGGELNAAFLEADLVDQVYLTIVPKVLGGAEAPTWFEGQGFKLPKRFRLDRCRKVGDELYLRYKKSR